MSKQNELDQMINSYDPTKHHEFEIKVKYRDVNKYKQFLKYYTELQTPEVKQTINFINTRSAHSEIKELYFEKGVQIKESKRFYRKQQINPPVYINSGALKCELKATLNAEIPILDSPDFDLVRFKQRFSFQLDQWRIDFTFVKTSNTKVITELQDIKKQMFGTDDLWEYSTQEIEFEFTGANLNIISIKEVMSILDEFKNGVINTPIPETNFLEKLSNIIGVDSALKNTLKQVLKNPIELNKLQYFEDVVPHIQNFSISWKASGITAILIIDKNISMQTTEFVTLSENRYFECDETILICEMIGDIFYAYDCVKYDGVNCANENLDKRLSNLNNIITKAKEWESLKLKETIKLSSTNDVKKFMKTPPTEYENDGIIFTSNNQFNKTKFFKWKQVTHRTIDFLLKDCPKNLLGIYPYVSKPGHNLYILFSGINARDYTKFNMKKIQYHDIMFPIQTSSYFPIQFSPSSEPFAYLFWDEDKNLDNKIVELRYKNGWKFIRIREDRADDFKKKNYYGNNFRIAERIWQNYKNPLTKKLLGASPEELSDGLYFRKNNSEIHFYIRRFNNMVKAQLIEHVTNWEYTPNSWVIDLGSGKGQDLHKYLINKSVRNVLMIDNNENNLYEIINRKYEYANNSMTQGPRLGIFIKNIDLNADWQDSIHNIIQSFPIMQKNSTKLIICNFAIHYFAKSESTIFNFVNLVDELLPKGSRFMFTCLNGKNVFDLLTENRGNWGDNDGVKYFIEFATNKHKTFRGGEEINILLPFSNGELFKEPLVNLELVEKLFKKKKITLESSGNFGESYLEKFRQSDPNNYNKLDALDMEYIKLLWFNIYYKKNSKV
jgi:hypothetical protein